MPCRYDLKIKIIKPMGFPHFNRINGCRFYSEPLVDDVSCF